MKILVTGTNGNIGGAFCAYAKEKYGCDVDRVSLRNDNWKTMDLSSYDAVYFCVGITDENAPNLFDINERLAYDFALFSKQAGVKNFIYLSSMAVYDFSNGINEAPIDAETVAQPRSQYGKSKLAGEEKIIPLANLDFHIHIVRAPSIYGKNTEAYLELYERAAQKGYCFVMGKENKRSSIFIDNLSELIWLICNSEAGEAVTYYCPQNKDAFSYHEYVEAVSKCAKIKCRMIKIPRFLEKTLLKSKKFYHKHRAIMYSYETSAAFSYEYSKTQTLKSIEDYYLK